MMRTVNVLTDIPEIKDSFGTHDRVTEAIADTITQGEKGLAISLLGKWGSGKSTVINLLKKKIETNDIKIFLFDAWEHQGDPLRRSFLETLISFLQENKWIKIKEWNEEKDKLLKKKITQRTVQNSRITAFGYLASIFTILTPFFITLFNFLTNNDYPRWNIIVAIVLCCWPIIFVLLASIINLCKTGKMTLDSSVFFKDSKVDIVSDTLLEPEPTSIEFQSIFNRLLSDALKNKNRKLIFVIDNLDRISSEDASGIWATMKAFFEIRNGNTFKDEFWLIVPFDKEHLHIAGIKEKCNQEDIDQSFLDKTFQVGFLVPTPIISDGKRYFIELMDKALPGSLAEEKLHCYKIFISQYPDDYPSPRDYKIFINELGAICRQWDEKEMPLETIAFYIVLKKNPDWSLKKYLLKKDSFTNYKSICNFLPDEFIEQLAALSLNVPPGKAMEVFLEPKLRAEIKNAGTDLNRYNEIKSFPFVLNTIIADIFSEGCTPEDIFVIASNFANVNFENCVEMNDTREIILRRIMKLEDIDELNNEVLNTVAFIFKNSKENMHKKITTLFSSLYIEIEDSFEKYEVLYENLISFSKMLSLYEKIDIKEVYIPTTVFYRIVTYLNSLDSKTDNELQEFIIRIKPFDTDKITEEISNDFNSEKINKTSVKNVELLSSFYTDCDWYNFVLELKKRIVSDPVVGTQDKIEYFCEIISILLLKKLIGEDSISSMWLGELQHHINLFHINGIKLSNLPCAMTLLLKYNAEGINLLPSIQNASIGANLFTTIINSIDTDKDLLIALLLGIKDMMSSLELFNLLNGKCKAGAIFLLKSITEDDNFDDFFKADSFLENYDLIKANLPQDTIDSIVKSLDTSNDLRLGLLNNGFDLSLSNIYDLLISINPNRLSFATKIAELISNETKKYTAEQWKLLIIQNSEIIMRIQNLLRVNESIDFNTSFTTALKILVEQSIEGKYNINLYPEEWNLYVKFLNPGQESMFNKYFLDAIFNANRSEDIPKETPIAALKIIGKELKCKGLINGENIDNFCILAINIIKRNDIDEITWLREVILSNKKWIGEIEEDKKGIIQGPIQTAQERVSNLNIDSAEYNLLNEIIKYMESLIK